MIEVGHSAGVYGVTNNYGEVLSGDFPGELFKDGQDRDVASIREDAEGTWLLYYEGGANHDWITTDEDIVLTVSYQSGKDTRRFHMGGFIEAHSGDTLRLDPPIPSRDWDVREGQQVRLTFSRGVVPEAVATVPRLTDPTAEAGTVVEFVARVTPGGGVVAQGLIVIVAYCLYILKAKPSTIGILGGVIVLVLSAWVPVWLGFGSTLAAAATLMNVAAGAFVYKVFVARTET